VKSNLDPRTKLIMGLCLSTLSLFFNEIQPLLYLLLFTVLLLQLFGINFLKLFYRVRSFLPVLVILLLVQSIFAPEGRVLLAVGDISILTTGGITRSLCVGLRMLIIIGSALFLLTSSSRDIVLGLIQWKIPYEISFMIAMGLRFLPVIRDEVINTVTAIQLRGLDLKKVPWGQKIAVYSSVFFPLVYGIIIKAQKLSIAMETRGFRAYPRRTYMRRLFFSPKDYFCILFFLSGSFFMVTYY
jgi:energy-coupling factor transport system permease protein